MPIAQQQTFRRFWYELAKSFEFRWTALIVKSALLLNNYLSGWIVFWKPLKRKGSVQANRKTCGLTVVLLNASFVNLCHRCGSEPNEPHLRSRAFLMAGNVRGSQFSAICICNQLLIVLCTINSQLAPNQFYPKNRYMCWPISSFLFLIWLIDSLDIPNFPFQSTISFQITQSTSKFLSWDPGHEKWPQKENCHITYPLPTMYKNKIIP